MRYVTLPDIISITCGSLDPDLGGRVKELWKEGNEGEAEPRHIFTSEKALWNKG